MENRECPNCKEILNKDTGVNHDDKPKQKDITICINCASINQYDKDLNIIPIEDDIIGELEINNPAQYDLIMEVVSKIKKMNE